MNRPSILKPNKLAIEKVARLSVDEK